MSGFYEINNQEKTIMYIPRSQILKMKIINEKREMIGLDVMPLRHSENGLGIWLQVNRKKVGEWIELNYDAFHEDDGVDELNSKIILTKEQSDKYKEEMGEDWPWGVVSDWSRDNVENLSRDNTGNLEMDDEDIDLKNYITNSERELLSNQLQELFGEN